LITLNEMCSHQELKDNMIDQELVRISSEYLLHSEPEIRREAALLLGSLFSVMKGRNMANSTSYEGMKKMLFEDIAEARESVVWMINRFVSARDGVQLLADNGVI